MESMVLAISLLASIGLWIILKAQVRDHRPSLIELTYWLYGIRPLSRRNTYMSVRRRSFMSTEAVRQAEESVLKFVHYLAIPVVSALPLVAGIIAYH